MAAMALRQYASVSSGGASKAAGFIAKQRQEAQQQLQNSYTLGQQAKGSVNELYQVFEACRQPNWDGYSAAPVSENAFRLGAQFLDALPLGTPAPAIGAEPDGHLTLEWHRSPRRTISVSVSPEGDLHYAALVGFSKYYGTEPFYGKVPKIIIDLIYLVIT